jgi:hypothetical protein
MRSSATSASPRLDAVRAEVFRLLGSFAEHTTHVAQRTTEDAVEFEIATGTTAPKAHTSPTATSFVYASPTTH